MGGLTELKYACIDSDLSIISRTYMGRAVFLSNWNSDHTVLCVLSRERMSAKINNWKMHICIYSLMTSYPLAAMSTSASMFYIRINRIKQNKVKLKYNWGVTKMPVLLTLRKSHSFVNIKEVILPCFVFLKQDPTLLPKLSGNLQQSSCLCPTSMDCRCVPTQFV
jgi:hypothetical protein